MDSRLISRGQPSAHSAAEVRYRVRGDGVYCGLPRCDTRLAHLGFTELELHERTDTHLRVAHPVQQATVTPICDRLSRDTVIRLRSRT